MALQPKYSLLFYLEKPDIGREEDLVQSLYFYQHPAPALGGSDEEICPRAFFCRRQEDSN